MKKRFSLLVTGAASLLAMASCSNSPTNTASLSSSSSALGSSSSVLASSSSVVVGQTKAQQMVARMGRGMNLGNALDAPYEGDWGVTLDESYFKLISDSGFKNVRIPVQWQGHLLDTVSCQVQPDFMARVVWAVTMANKYGLIAIINQHHDAAMSATPLTQESCFINTWKDIANNTKSFSDDSLIWEVMNEPQDSLLNTAAVWNGIQGRTLDTLRTIDPARTIMIGGVNYNSESSLPQLKLRPQDLNVIATFHFYDPFTFTHQGADFITPILPTGVTWTATPSQASAINNVFDAALAWSKANNVPIYLGEFGSYQQADSASRPIWTEFVAQAAVTRGFAFAYWEFCSTFGIYNAITQVWNTGLVDALLHPSRGFGVPVRPNLDTVPYVLFDDFDGLDGKLANITALSTAMTLKAGLPLDSAKGTWYAYNNDSSLIMKGDNTPIFTEEYMITHALDTPATMPDFYDMITDGGYSGRGLHVKMKLYGSEYPYVGVGASFNGKETYDFTHLQALSFWAKGSGTFKIAWVMPFTDTCCVPNWGRFSIEVTLTNDWTQYIIWKDQWLQTPWSALEAAGYQWSDNNKAVRALEFSNGQGYGQVVDDSLELYLDNVRFYGMNKSAFGL